MLKFFNLINKTSMFIPVVIPLSCLAQDNNSPIFERRTRTQSQLFSFFSETDALSNEKLALSILSRQFYDMNSV